jgi:hypothetical protein
MHFFWPLSWIIVLTDTELISDGGKTKGYLLNFSGSKIQ